MEHALQMARNDICEATGYDFLNDGTFSGREIYTYGNYMGSSYDYSDNALIELAEKVSGHHQELAESSWCRYLFSELDMKLQPERD